MDVRSRLALNIKRLRKARGWSQEALADAVPIDRTYISGIERKVRNPTIDVIERIARALGVSAGSLLDETSEEG
jgi:transcriptional regulator with XRE-family HTH domain